MECLKLCVAFGLASVARGSAAAGPLSYLLQYKRSVLANPTGLAAFNGFGGVPFGFAAYGQPGFAAYNQPGFAAYGQPGFAAYGQPGFAAYGQPGFGAYGPDELRPHQARALAPAAAYQYGAQSGYGFDAAPASGYPFAVHYKLSPAVAAPQLIYAPDAQQPRTAPNAAPPLPAQDMARQVRVMSPTVAAAESTAARLQIPSAYQPVPTSDAAAAPSSAPPSATAVPADLFLELRPPHHSEPSIDYSKSPVSSPSDGGPHVDFGSASSSSADANRESYPAPGYDTSVPPSNAYIVPSISYRLPTNTYSHTEPNAVYGPSVPGAGDGKTASKSIPDAPNDFASNALYGESEPGGAVPSSFSDAYYSVPPVDVPSASRGNSNPTSANTYGDSNSIQSSSRGNGKPIAGNVRGDSTSSDKRETSNPGQYDKSPPINYFGGDYKNVQRDTY